MLCLCVDKGFIDSDLAVPLVSTYSTASRRRIGEALCTVLLGLSWLVGWKRSGTDSWSELR